MITIDQSNIAWTICVKTALWVELLYPDANLTITMHNFQLAKKIVWNFWDNSREGNALRKPLFSHPYEISICVREKRLRIGCENIRAHWVWFTQGFRLGGPEWQPLLSPSPSTTPPKTIGFGTVWLILILNSTWQYWHQLILRPTPCEHLKSKTDEVTFDSVLLCYYFVCSKLM